MEPPEFPEKELITLETGEAVVGAVIGPARAEKSIPDAYRLVTKDDGSGNTIYQLQGYFTWTQDRSQCGGEWRDLETQDWLYAKDDIPFGPLP